MSTKKTPLKKIVSAKKIPQAPPEDIAFDQDIMRSSIAYLTIVGWLIAYFLLPWKNSLYERFHIVQAFWLHMLMFFLEVLGSYSMLPAVLVRVSWIVYIIICMVMFVFALQSKKTQIAFVGDKFQKWFSFL